MPIPRFYVPDLNPAEIGKTVPLAGELAHHLTVRRLRTGEPIRLFDGQGREWEGILLGNGRGLPNACRLVATVTPLPEPRQPRVLATALLPADRLDWVVQKGVELGMTHWVPLVTTYSQVGFSAERAQKKFAHWTKIAAHAAAQCGRATVPRLLPPTSLYDLPERLAQDGLSDVAWFWAQPGGVSFAAVPCPSRGVLLAIGPEGGWHPDEAAWLAARPATAIGLAPWVLRAETAAVTVLAQALVAFANSGEGG